MKEEWPQKLPWADNKVKPFYHVRSELHTTKDFITYSLWLVTPAAYQDNVL